MLVFADVAKPDHFFKNLVAVASSSRSIQVQCIQLREQIYGIFYCLSLFFTGGEIWELQILFFVYLYINAILTHDMFYNCGIVVNVEVILG